MILSRTTFTLTLFLLTSLLTGCALPSLKDRSQSEAFSQEQTAGTRLGRAVGYEVENHPGLSGIAALQNPLDAFVARALLAEASDRSLDVQYYIWQDDITGKLLLYSLYRAAERGVRVRLLLDDNGIAGMDEWLSALNHHDNVEVRLFNPFVIRSSRALGFLTDFGRLNHRMHNKLMIADNAVALLGGRNIGDHYFDVSEESNYRDLDIAAVGPVVRDASSVFDYFWNKDWSVPVGASVNRTFGETDLEVARVKLEETIDTEGYPYPFRQRVTAVRQSMSALTRQLVWAPAFVVWDDPADFIAGKSGGKILKALAGKVDGLKRELLMENAYFVPTQAGADKLKELSARGVKVRVLTNSLSSNDVVAVHAGYSKYRVELLEAGVELHEVRADSAKVQQTLFSTDSKAGLHTKAAVFDGASIFVGSFNLDPRSANLNTEIGLYVESTELARRLTAFLNEGVSLQNSYRLELDDNGSILWKSEENGEIVTFTSDPGSTLGQRFTTGIIATLPVEGQL